MALRVALVPFGGVRPDLDALAGKWRTVARAPHSARHPETTTANPIYDWRTGAVIVGPTTH